MALSLVQHGAESTLINSGTSGQILPAVCAVGNAVVAIIITDGSAANTVSAVTSSIGTFTKICDEGEGSSVWLCKNATGAADTITVTTANGATRWQGIGMEWSGGVTGAVTLASVSSTTTWNEFFTNKVGQAVIGMYWFPTITADPSSPWTNFTAWANGPHVAYQASASGANAEASWSHSGTGIANYGGITLIGNSGSGFLDFF